MNYKDNIKQSYENVAFANSVGVGIILADDGNEYLLDMSSGFSFTQSNIVARAMYVLKNQNLDYVPRPMIIEMGLNEAGVFIVNTECDFIELGNSQNNVTFAQKAYGTDYNQNSEMNATFFSDLDYYNGNPIYTQYYVSEYTWGSFSRATASSRKSFILDFSMQRENIWNGQARTFGVQNETFYNYVITHNYETGFNIAYGSPLHDLVSTNYQNGYTNGTYAGYQNGYLDGFRDGGGMNVDNNTANAFNYIGGAFASVASILNIEVLPHITLGLCFSIPLTLVLIMTIFRLVKK